MIYGLLILFFLQGSLILWMVRIHDQAVEKLTKRFDARERELLDRLMYVTKTPWNLPQRVDSEPKKEEEPPDLQWRDY